MATVKTEPKPEPSLTNESPPESKSSTPSANKRKLEADVTPPEPADTKRVKQETGAVQPVPDDAPPRKRSADFWYPDGNVVVVVGDTAFKLYQARLARFSAVFTARFEDQGSQMPQKVEGCPVYDVAGLSVEDFGQFLAALETPFKFASAPPPEPTLISILRASNILSCPTARDLAVGHLRALWSADDATLSGGRRAHTSATNIIRISRDCDVPELRRRAFYEILRSPDFWEVLDRRREDIPLPDTDVIALCRARDALQQAWCALAFAPPSGPGTGEDGKLVETSCVAMSAVMMQQHAALVRAGRARVANVTLAGGCAGRLVTAVARKGTWRSDMIDRGDFERGRGDPIGNLQVLLTERRAAFAEAGWCEKCMLERRKAWADAQVKWWGLLDRWFMN